MRPTTRAELIVRVCDWVDGRCLADEDVHESGMHVALVKN